MHENCRHIELGKMFSAQLRSLTRRVQRVGEQEKSRRYLRLLGSQHACLTSTIRMASEKDPSGNLCPQNFHGPAQAFTVARSHSWEWWSMRLRLAKGQIAAQNKIAGIRKCIGSGSQQL